jgi:hypothetical protein
MRELVAEHHPGMMGGGIVVTTREVAENVPLDPRFKGWGQEDNSWAMALRCLAGPPRKGSADLIHLHHPAPERISRARGNPDGIELRSRYCSASKHPDRMAALIQEAREHLYADGYALHPDS